MHIRVLEYQRFATDAEKLFRATGERRLLATRHFGTEKVARQWERSWFKWKTEQKKTSAAWAEAAKYVELKFILTSAGPDIEIYSAALDRRKKASAEHKQLVAEALDELEKSGQLQNLNTWKEYR